ncbi:hypothetical protein B0H11DRAFT_2258694 [Mycena galericulata]|nr:hypothetical protein B0H11DRAFT_2258694 [Mycena galericulata]
MGTALAPGTYANLFLAGYEVKEFKSDLLHYSHFIDDTFAIIHGDISKVREFQERFGKLHPNMKMEWSQSRVSLQSIIFILRLEKEKGSDDSDNDTVLSGTSTSAVTLPQKRKQAKYIFRDIGTQATLLNASYNYIETKFFHDWVPGAELPGRRALSGRILDTEVENIQADIQKKATKPTQSVLTETGFFRQIRIHFGTTELYELGNIFALDGIEKKSPRGGYLRSYELNGKEGMDSMLAEFEEDPVAAQGTGSANDPQIV